MSKLSLKIIKLFLMLSLLFTTGSLLFAEELKPQPTPEGSSAVKVSLQIGTQIPVTIRQTLSSALNSVGDTVCLTVDNDITVNGSVVIKKGTLVKGKVNEVLKSRPVNKPGDINFTVLYITAADGQNIPLEKELYGKNGKRRSGALAGNIFLWGVFGLLTKGADAVLPLGLGYDLTTSSTIEIMVDVPAVDNSYPVPDLNLTGEIMGTIPVKLKDSKINQVIHVNLAVPIETIPQLSSNTGDISIIKVADFYLPKPIEATKCNINTTKGILEMQFPWWSLIQYCTPGDTDFDIYLKLTDGKTAIATIKCKTDWKSK